MQRLPILVLLAAAALRFSSAAQAAPKPNFIFILTDDQRYDAIGCLGNPPFLKTPNLDRLRNEGALFKNTFVTTSLCAPSRAAFLTGTYNHTNGVTWNEIGARDPDWNKTPNFAALLQKAGYKTGFIGKLHMAPTNEPRPGFDYWFSFKGQGVYEDPVMNENGTERKVPGYITEILNDAALAFIDKQPKDQPYALCLWHKAVHDPRTVREKDRDLYANEQLPEPASHKDDLSGKPKWQRVNVLSNSRVGQPMDVDPDKVPDAIPPKPFRARSEDHLNYYRLLTAVDDGIGAILAALEKRGDLDNTVILFGGDNGYFMGEHQLGDKRLGYEESIRIPFLVRYPKLIKPGTTINQMVLNIDVAPTLLDLAGVPVPKNMQGQSFRPLMEGKPDGWRTSFLYEYWLDYKPTIPDMVGVRTTDWKLVRYPGSNDIDEMYDLKNDPIEMKNLATDPAQADKKRELTTELEKLMRETNYISPPNPAKEKMRQAAASSPAR
jgi:N-acetylglucosamine-6-sulfatase